MRLRSANNPGSQPGTTPPVPRGLVTDPDFHGCRVALQDKEDEQKGSSSSWAGFAVPQIRGRGSDDIAPGGLIIDGRAFLA